MPLQGIAQLSIIIQNHSLEIEAWVGPTIREPLILGYPWLKAQRAILELSSGTLYLGQPKRFSTQLIDAPIPAITGRVFDGSRLQHDFPESHQEAFRNLVQQFSPIFDYPGGLCQTQTTEHSLTITTPRPIRVAPYGYSESKRKIIHEQVHNMLNEGIIEPSTSPYNSPIVLVKKDNGQTRFCVDYRKLNDSTEDVVQPIPKIHDLLKTIGPAKIFSTIDLKSGYWQIPMGVDSKKFTAFTTPSGRAFQFRVMPFGLKNAPSTFQRFMGQEVLVGDVEQFSLAYLDDIIIYSNTWEEHLQHLTLVFERLKIHKLTCSVEKCAFGKTKLKYLGHLVSNHGNEARTEHIKAILGFPPPPNKKALQKFLGTCNWLREYIPHFATLTSPLTNLLAGKKSYQWTHEAQAAFEEVQRKMQQPLQLCRPDPESPYVIQTEISPVGLGAVLYQLSPGQDKKIVSYGSAKFDTTQARYELFEKECFAVIWAIKRYQSYLGAQSFTIRTNLKALAWLERLKDEKSKLSQWALLLNNLRFKAVPRGKQGNELPHALSQHPSEGPAAEPQVSERLLPPERLPPAASNTPEIFGIMSEGLLDEVLRGQQQDNNLGKIVQTLDDPAHQDYRLLNDGIWKRFRQNWRLVVPAESKPRVLYEFHDAELAGHPGADETLRAIQLHYTWPHMRQDVRKYVRECYLCSCTKSTRLPKDDVLHPHRPGRPWETVAVDFMGPYPRSAKGKRFLLVVTDLFTRWVEAFPLGTSDASAVIRIMEGEVFPRWGYPKAILSDNGPQFCGKKWVSALAQWHIHHWTTPIYHPRANPTERRNQELKKGLRLHLHGGNQRRWDEHLPQILFTLRSRQNAATGLSPSEALLGRTLQRPGDWKLHSSPSLGAGDLTSRIQQITKRQDTYQRSYTPRYQPGDLVYTRNHILSNAIEGIHAGLASPWEGPFPITRALGSNIFLVQKGKRLCKIHGNEIKPAHGPSQETLDSPNPTGSSTWPTGSPIAAVLTQVTDVSPPAPPVRPKNPESSQDAGSDDLTSAPEIRRSAGVTTPAPPEKSLCAEDVSSPAPRRRDNSQLVPTSPSLRGPAKYEATTPPKSGRGGLPHELSAPECRAGEAFPHQDPPEETSVQRGHPLDLPSTQVPGRSPQPSTSSRKALPPEGREAPPPHQYNLRSQTRVGRRAIT